MPLFKKKKRKIEAMLELFLKFVETGTNVRAERGAHSEPWHRATC